MTSIAYKDSRYAPINLMGSRANWDKHIIEKRQPGN